MILRYVALFVRRQTRQPDRDAANSGGGGAHDGHGEDGEELAFGEIMIYQVRRHLVQLCKPDLPIYFAIGNSYDRVRVGLGVAHCLVPASLGALTGALAVVRGKSFPK